MIVLDKQAYLAETNRQLTDKRFYKNLDSDPTTEFHPSSPTPLAKRIRITKIGVNV